MQQAYANLNATGKEIPDFNIGTTHRYVRFLPSSIEEYSLLENDTLLDVSEVPFDYEIEGDGFYYHDPTLPFDGFTWLYAIAEPGYILPDVHHELLADLFLPPDVDELAKSYDDKWISFFDRLEHEALKITGNLDDDPSLKTTKGNRWQPKGHIRLWDEASGDYMPIQHVVVRARRWFRTISGITDANGYYECNGTFRRAANYSITWSRYHFSVNTNDIRNGNSIGALLVSIGSKKTKLKGPKKTGDWDLYLDRFSVSNFHGNIFRAAAKYYYGDIDNLRRPPLYESGGPKMRIIASLGVINTSGSEYYIPEAIEEYSVFDSDGKKMANPHWIEVYYSYIRADEMFWLITYNLALASLCNVNEDDFYSRAYAINDSYATGIAVHLTRKTYPAFMMQYSRGDYTGLAEDMMDGFKTSYSNYFFGFSEFGYKEYQDSISGYTIKQIEESANGVFTEEEWLQNIKNLYVNETEDKLDAAFDYWFFN